MLPIIERTFSIASFSLRLSTSLRNFCHFLLARNSPSTKYRGIEIHETRHFKKFSERDFSMNPSAISKLVVAFSVVGIIFLYWISTLVAPVKVGIEEIPNYEGKYVDVEGVVSDVRIVSGGSCVLTLRRNGSSVDVFVRGGEGLDIGYGSEVSVVGVVRLYEGEHEILTSADRVELLNSSEVVFVPQLAALPQKYVGERVRVVGTVSRLYTNVFYLEGGGAELRVMANASVTETLDEGEKIVADGVFEYDEQSFRFELRLLALSCEQIELWKGEANLGSI